MSSQDPLGQVHKLTFGVEFEFLAAQRRSSSDPHPHDKRWTIPSGTLANAVALEAQDFVVSLLKRNGIPALSDVRYNYPRFDDSSTKYVQREANAQEVQQVPNRVAAHDFWVVSDDQGIIMNVLEDVAGYHYQEMEVASRILPETEFSEVKKVYSLIQSRMRTQVNSSCGLHIHVGIRHLSVGSIKKLVTLLMVAEEKGLFKEICAPHRSSNYWCQPVSQYSRAVRFHDGPPRDLPNHSLTCHLPQQHNISPDLYLGLKHIWNCSTIDEVAKETRTSCGAYPGSANSTFTERGAFALRNDTYLPDICDDQVLADLTIEFRHKESTGSASQDHHWLKLCLGLVRAAEWPQERFRAAVKVFSTANTLKGQLVGLGVKEKEVRWWLGIQQHHHDHPNLLKRTEFIKPENI